MTRRPLLFLAALVIPLAMPLGCARGVPLPVPPSDRETAAALLEAAAEEAARVRRYQSILEVRGEGEDGRFSADLLLVFERPEDAPDRAAVERLRMELFGAMGGARWVLVAGPGGVTAIAPSKRAFARDTGLGAFTGSLIGVAVNARDVAAMLSGVGVPLRGNDRFRWNEGDGGIELDGGSRILWDGERVARAVAVRPGTPRRVHYEVHYPRGSRWPPREFEVRSPRVTASFVVTEIQVNAELHPDSFELDIPDGFREVAASALARDP